MNQIEWLTNWTSGVNGFDGGGHRIFKHPVSGKEIRVVFTLNRMKNEYRVALRGHINVAFPPLPSNRMPEQVMAYAEEILTKVLLG